MSVRPTRQQALASAVVGLIAALAAGAFGFVTPSSSSSPEPAISQSQPRLDPVAPEPLVPTDIQQVRDALGPFETILVATDTPTPDTRNPAVLILNDDGSTEASTAWTVPFEPTSWTRENDFRIRGLSFDVGFATIAASNRRTYVVRAGQPFLFEDEPNRMLVVGPDGQMYALTMARAQAQRQSL
ncbi:MAG: hypothetical protein ACRESP_02880 [Pseudomonas sp.]